MSKKSFLVMLAIGMVALVLNLALRENEEPSVTVLQGVAMTVPYRISVGKYLSDKQKKELLSLITSVFSEIDTRYNKWNGSSELSQLNQLGSEEEIELSKPLAQFLGEVDRIVALSEGRFDPSINSLQEVWKKALEKGEFPEQIAVEKAKESVGWSLIHLQGNRFYKERGETTLDLGGIAKGYCVDSLVAALNRAGYRDVLVDWGGELKATGYHPEGRPWRVFISDRGSLDLDDAVDIVELNDQALATSGNYLQNWTVSIEGRQETYCHVIDGRLGCPLRVGPGAIASVTIMAESCAFADGIATAAMLFPSASEADVWLQSLKKEFPTLQYWIVATE